MSSSDFAPGFLDAVAVLRAERALNNRLRDLRGRRSDWPRYYRADPDRVRYFAAAAARPAFGASR